VCCHCVYGCHELNDQRSKDVEARQVLVAAKDTVYQKERTLDTIKLARQPTSLSSYSTNGSLPWRKLLPARDPRRTRMIYAPDRLKALLSRPRRDQLP
jgi:hypothetical protein